MALRLLTWVAWTYINAPFDRRDAPPTTSPLNNQLVVLPVSLPINGTKARAPRPVTQQVYNKLWARRVPATHLSVRLSVANRPLIHR